MSRIAELFLKKEKNVLNVYCTAGFPELNSIMEVLLSLQKHGADLVELGIPYSDPIADGPVIQQSNMKALGNGISIYKILQQLKDCRKNFHLPLIFMGYLNPVMQYGLEKFCMDANGVGVDGIILPDLPIYEFENEYKDIFKRHKLDFIFLVTPETSEERIKEIDELSTGFIYAVSSSSTTGKNTDMNTQQDYFKRLQQMDLKNPVLVGFGIKDKQTFQAACEFTNGAIIGSAYINALNSEGNIDDNTANFLNKIVK